MRIADRTDKRNGFTLIELIVVILIIGVLAALITSGVMKVMEVIPRTQTVNEIRQMAIGLEAFKSKYKVYPPSAIVLPPPAGSASQAYLNAIWPRANVTGIAVTSWVPGATTASVTLSGDQCLVYFLQGPTGNGWSTNPANPTQTTGSMVPPFFTFEQSRLVNFRGNGVPSYQDPYATVDQYAVYAYFCSGRSGYSSTDCPGSLNFNITPPGSGVGVYYNTVGGTNRPYNATSFQIISAGKDFTFGPGGQWAPGSNNPYGAASPGYDDLSNFYGDMLGAN